MQRLFGRLAALCSLALAVASTPASAWSPRSQVALGVQARSIAPPDFRRQLERHSDAFQDGLVAPFRDVDALAHQSNDDGKGYLTTVLTREVDRTIAMIRAHRSFEQIAYQAGLVVHYANDLNNPLNCSAADREEGRYFGDFVHYLEAASTRIPLLFYGLEASLERGDLENFVQRSLEGCRQLYPLVGREYRRIEWRSGAQLFDDRSTAFGIASIAHSRALTDAALLLRHIWIAGGGADWRRPPMREDGMLLMLPEPSPSPLAAAGGGGR
jgi:hypothetical protein